MPLVSPSFPYRRPVPVPNPVSVPNPISVAGPVPVTSPPHPARPVRDVGIDAIRGGCLLVVVVLHSLMVGVQRGTDGGLLTSVALSHTWGFTVASWFFQVMPLFFMAGGFASLTQWRRLQSSGVSPAEYVRGRVRRLVLPTAVMVTCVGSTLLVARVCGASPDLLASAGLHAVQPLWFLAVYVGCTALVPAMAWLHQQHRMATLAGLGAGVVVVDLLARVTAPGVGFLNLALVWPLMQQLGFLVLDGVAATWSRRRLLGAAAGCLGLLGTLMALGYSPNMLVNLNPPTLALVFLGLAQFFLLVLLRPAIDSALTAPRAAKVATGLSAWSMGVYLWHLPMALLLVSVLGGLGAGLPQPESLAWWFTRIPWLLAVAGTTVAMVAAAKRVEPVLLRSLSALVRLLHTMGAVQGFTRMSRRLQARAGVRSRSTRMAGPSAVALVSVVAAVVGTGAVLILGGASWVGVPVAVVLLWTSVFLSSQR